MREPKNGLSRLDKGDEMLAGNGEVLCVSSAAAQTDLLLRDSQDQVASGLKVTSKIALSSTASTLADVYPRTTFMQTRI